MKKDLRKEMPETAAFIDALREAFGTTHINTQIRRGLAGEPTFYACEGEHEIGTDWLKRESDEAD